MADLCGVDPEMIHPDDTIDSLLWIQWDGGFLEDFVFGLGHRAGVRLSYPLGDAIIADPSFGTLVRELAEQRSKLVPEREE